MADYKGLNIRFRGDTTDASKALHMLSSEAKAAQGNLQGIQNALKSTATNGKELDTTLREFQLEQVAKQAEVARERFEAYRDMLPQLKDKHAELRKEIESTKAAMEGGEVKLFKDDGTTMGMKELAAHLNSVEEQERRTSAAIEDATRNMYAQQSAAQALAAQQEAMAASFAASQTNLGQFGTNATEVGNNLNALGESISSVGDKMTLVSGIAAMTFGRKIVSSTEEFGNAIAQLGGYLEIGGDQLKDMSDDALEWGKNTQFSATESANAMNELAKGGMTQAQISGGAMKATMELAAAGSLDMAQAASVAVQAIKTFNLPVEQASQVADALAGAANKSTAEVTELANGFKYVGGWASMAGWNINDVSGALALLSDHGLQSEMAGTALRNVMQRLAAPTNTAAKLMNAYGFSVRDSTGQMVSATEVVRRLNETFGKLGDEEKQNVLSDIFGARALPAAVALMDEGADKLQEYIDSTTQAGYATEMAKNRMGELGWALEYLRGESETAAVNFGQALAPTIISVAKSVEDLLTWFNSLSDGEKQTIAQMALMVAAAGPVLSIVGHLTSGIGGLISTAGTAATTIANYNQLMKAGGDSTKVFAESIALAQAPMKSTAEDMQKVAQNAKGIEGALNGLYGTIAVAAVAVLAEQLKSLADEMNLVTDATKDVDDIAIAARVSVANVGDDAEDSGAKLLTYSQALNTANESLKQSAEYNKNVSDSLKEMEGNVSSAERYAATIKELSSLGSLSAAQQEQLKQAVDGYNQVTGAAVRITDEMRGTLNLMPQDIDRVTEAYVRQAKTQAYTTLLNKAIEEQERAQKNAQKAAEDANAALNNVPQNIFNVVRSMTSLGQVMNVVEYGKMVIGLQGVSDASNDAAYDVEYFRKAAEAAGLTSDQYNDMLRQMGLLADDAGGAAKDAGDNIEEGAEQAAQAAQDAAKAIKKANDAIYREQQRAFDYEYKAQQKAYDAEYKAAQKAYDQEYKAAQKAYDNEYKIQQKAFDQEYKALQKQLDKEYKATQKAFDQAYKQRQKELDKQYDAYKKQLDSEEAALKKSLDAKSTALKKQLDSELATLKKANDQRLKQQKKADEAETKAFKAETDKRVAALQAEYKERLRMLELQYGGSDIDAQIKSLKAQTKAEQEEIERRKENEKKAELEKAVEQAKTRRARADAEKELNDYLAELAQEQRERERDAQIERLEEQKSALKDELTAKKDALKEEYDARIEALKEQRAAELEVTKEANDLEYETLKEQLDGLYNARKEANDAKIEQQKEANQVEIDNLKEHHSTLLENMKEQHTAQLEQLKEQQSAQLETIKEGQQARLDNLKESQQAQLDAMKEGQQAQLESLKDSQQSQLDALKESQQDQLQALKESQQDQLQALKDSMDDAVNTLQSGAREGVGKYASEMGKLPDDTDNVMSQNESNIDAAMHRTKSDMGIGGSEGGAAFANNLRAQSGAVSSSANLLTNNAKSPLASLPTAAGQYGVGTGSSFASGIGQGGVTAQTQASNIARGVSSALRQPADNSGTWGYDFLANFNNSMVDFWNNTLLPNLNNIGNSIANIFKHSTPKEGPLKGDDVWFYHMMQNLDRGMQRGIPELMGTVDGLANDVADGMDIDLVGDLIANMRENEMALANQSRRMADIVTEQFNPYASANYSIGYDIKPMARMLTNGVTEALRSGVPQQAGVTIVIQNARFANDMDVDRFSERVTARVAAKQRRGW